MADKTYHASVGFVQDNSDDFGDWADEDDGGDGGGNDSTGSLFDSNRSQGQQQDSSSSSSEQEDWLRLSPFKRLEKICNDSDIYKRQLVGRTAPGALVSVADSSFDVARILLILNKVSNDPEVSVRLDLAESLPHICLTCHSRDHAPQLRPLVLSHLLPLNLRLLGDREVKVRKAAQKSLIVLLENDILDSTTVDSVVCTHVLSMACNHDEVYVMTAVELMSTMAPLIGWELTESTFVPKLLDLCSSSQLNVRLICATKIGDFCAVVSQDMIEKSLLPCFVQLTLDSMWNVRKACAHVIMSVSCACSLELRKRTLAPIFARFLQDDSRWVRVTAFQTLGPFITTFAQPSITGLAYNQSGELVLVNPDGFEFKCPVIGESMNNIMNCMDLGMSMSNAAVGGGGGLANRDNSENNSSSNNSNNNSNGNTILARQNAILAAHEDEEEDEDDGYDMTMEEDSYENEEDEEDQVIDYSGGSVVGRIATTGGVPGVVETETGGGSGNGDRGGEMDENFNYFQYWRAPIPSVTDVEETLANITNLLKLSDSFDNLCSLVDSPTLPSPPPIPSNPPPTSTTTRQQSNGSTKSSSQSNNSEETSSTREHRKTSRKHRVKSKLMEQMMLNETQQDSTKDTGIGNNEEEESDSNKNSSSNEKSNSSNSETVSSHVDDQSRNNETRKSESVLADKEVDGNSSRAGDDDQQSGTENVNAQQHQQQGEKKPASSVKRVLEFLTDEDVTKWEREEEEKNWGVQEEKVGSISQQQVEEGSQPHGKDKKTVRRRSSGGSSTEESEEEDEEEDDSDSGNEERNRNNKTNTTTTTTSGIGSSNDLDDMSPQIPSACDQHIVPQELIDYYVKMFHCGTDQNENSDLARHCAFSLPAVALTLGSPNWSLLRPVTKRLACDEHWKVRRMVAASMHELAVIVGPGAATRDLLPVYTDLIKDLDEVRIGALRILSRFLYLLKPEGRLKFLPMFNKFLATEYEWNWRFRAEFVTQLGLSLGYFLPQQIWDYLAPLALLLLSDKVAAVRRVAVDLMDELFVHLSPSLPLTRCLTTTLAEDFAHSSSWSQRQTFASLCARLVTPTSSSAFEQQDENCSDGGGGIQSLSFGAGAEKNEKGGAAQQRRSGPSLPCEVFAMDILPHLIHLARDPVPNVRLCVARTLALNVAPLAYFQPPCPHSEVILETLHILRNDPDADVQYYASQKPDPSPSNEHNTTANTTDNEINQSHTTEDSSSSSSSDSSSPTSKKMMRTIPPARYDYFDDDDEEGGTGGNNSSWDPTIKQSQSSQQDEVDSSRVPKTEDDDDEGSSGEEEEDDGNCANNSQQQRQRSRPSAGQQEVVPDQQQHTAEQTSSSSSGNLPSTTATPSSPTSSNVNKIPPPLPVDSPRPRGGNRQQQQQQQSNARKRQRN